MEKFRTLRDMIENSAREYKDNIAFKIKKKDENNKVYYDDVTYERFNREIEFLARCIMRRGLQGERLAVIGKNSYEWLLSFMAILSSGSVAVPLDRGLMDYEIDEQLSRSGAKAIFYGEAFTERMKNKDSLLAVCMDSDEFKSMLLEGAESENKAEYDSLEIDDSCMSILLFTSGTTSQSKAVMLSHKNITSNVYAMSKWEKFYETDVNMALLPLHHTFGMTQLMLFLSFGMCNVFCEGLRIAKCLSEYGVTIFVGVPRVIDEMYRVIMRKLKAQNKLKKVNAAIKLSSLLRKLGIDIRRKLFKQVIDALGGGMRMIIIGAAAASPEVLKFFNNIGILSVQGYGLTETAPVISAENDDHMRENSVGCAIPGVEVKVVDMDENGIGELIARGDNVMLGYFGDEEKTAEVIKDGWFYTGDMVHIDDDGYIYICGRKKNVIVLSNGKNVFPEEIESLIGECDAIKECIVYAEGDTIFLRAVRDENFSGDTDAAINEHVKAVNDRLIYYKKISKIIITDEEMEKTTTGKIKKHSMIK